MKSTLATVLAFLVVLTIPASVAAKGNTTRITIQGSDLTTAIEITDPAILKNFDPWAGPGVRSGGVDQTEGFIVNWAAGAIAERADAQHRYEVSFYATVQNGTAEHLAYVVLYDYMPSADAQDSVYLPGKADQWYGLDVRSIFRGLEGNWFRPTSAWLQVVRPLIAEAIATPAAR